MAGISEGEVAVYDRQLRLWGVQAQQRLLKAKVLIWGLEGCNVEACKNLVLAGVSLTIRDHRTASASDVAFNYFLRQGDVGHSRAARAAERVQEMNPLCTVTSSSAAPDEDDAALRKGLEAFDVVLLSIGVLGYDVAKACAVDNACRETGAAFLMSVSCGEMACFVSDLNKHTMQERSSAQGGQPAAEQEPAKADEFSFPSLQAWADCSAADLQRQKVDDSILLVKLFLAFAQNTKAEADAGGKFEDFCRDVAKCVPKVDGMPCLKHAYSCFFVEPLMHVASVLAGLLSQEVIKAITKKDPPMMNTVCFNAFTSTALVECIPAPEKGIKRKAETVVADSLD